MSLITPEQGSPSSGENMVPSRRQRFTPLFAAVVVGIALVGYIRGIADRPEIDRPVAKTPETPDLSAPPAVKYADLPGAKIKPNSDWKGQLSSLKFNRPGYYDPVVRTEAMKLLALADRAKTRAFDTAPPVIPHPVEQQSAASCLACHAEGIIVDNRVATRISHEHFTGCTQCHIESKRSDLPWQADEVDNSFVGIQRAGPGIRAYPGAPPTIPHVTWMREDCMSCHGLVARPGLRTTHPYLTNCTQCHVTQTGTDPLAFPGGSSPGFPFGRKP